MLPSGASPAWRIACDVVALTSGRLGSFSYSDHRKFSVKHKCAFVALPRFESVRSSPVLAEWSPNFTWAKLTNSAWSSLPLSAFLSLYSVLVNQTLVCSVLQACSQRQVLPLLSSLAGMPRGGLYILNTELKHHFLSRPFPTSWATLSAPSLHAPQCIFIPRGGSYHTSSPSFSLWTHTSWANAFFLTFVIPEPSMVLGTHDSVNPASVKRWLSDRDISVEINGMGVFDRVSTDKLQVSMTSL